MNMAKAVEYIIGRKIAGPMDAEVQLTDNGNGVEITKWDSDALGIPWPTQEELEAAETAAIVGESAVEYKELRLARYPSAGDVIDALFKKEAGDSTEWDALDVLRDQIKLDIPKP